MNGTVSRVVRRYGTVTVATGGVLLGIAALVMLGRYA